MPSKDRKTSSQRQRVLARLLNLCKRERKCEKLLKYRTKSYIISCSG
jgi:hypothetical protein